MQGVIRYVGRLNHLSLSLPTRPLNLNFGGIMSTPLQRARWALSTLKYKHGGACKCKQCIKWMCAVANARRKAHGY